MKNKEAIKLISEYYNELDKELKHTNSAYIKGHLCAIRYILINVYGFKENYKWN